MSTTTVGPGHLDAALAAAASGDTLVVHGDQPGTDRRITKQLVLESGGDETVWGRLVLAADGIVLNRLRCNGRGGPSDGPSSWTVTAAGIQLVECDLTNEHWAIGVNTYGASADDLLVEGCRIHAIGKLKDVGTIPPWAASDQPYQHKDGRWSGNHEHGVYLTGLRGTVRENLIWDCADRAVQLRGSEHTLVERNLGFDCGMGLMFGDNADGFDVARMNLWLDNQIARRFLIESYQPGILDSAADWASNSDGRPAILAPGVDTSLCKTGDPLFDRATMKLAANSPALGYGPASIQPAVPPLPTNAQLRDQAVAELKKTSITYPAWAKTMPATSHWTKAFDALGRIT